MFLWRHHQQQHHIFNLYSFNLIANLNLIKGQHQQSASNLNTSIFKPVKLYGSCKAHYEICKYFKKPRDEFKPNSYSCSFILFSN